MFSFSHLSLRIFWNRTPWLIAICSRDEDKISKRAHKNQNKSSERSGCGTVKPQFYLIMIKICVCSVYMHALHYSSVPNRSACTFINFEKKFPPARPYLGLHVYWFWEKNPPCTFIWVALKFKIKSFKLKTACNFVKKSKFVVNNSTDMSK